MTQLPVYPEMTNQLRTMFARLAEAGMLPEVKDKVLALRIIPSLTDCGLSVAEKFTEKLSVDEPRRSNSGEDWKGGEVTASEADKPLEAPCRAQLSGLVSGKMTRSVDDACSWKQRGQFLFQ